MLVALAGAVSSILNFQDCWRTELLYCCDIPFSDLLFVRFIIVLIGRTGTAVGICCAVC